MEMMEHFILMRRIEQNYGKHICHRITNEWDRIEDADTVPGPIERAMREEMMEAFKHLRTGRAAGATEVYAEMILAT